MTTIFVNRSGATVRGPWILFALFIPVLPILGEAFLAYSAGYLLLTGGMVIVATVFAVLFIDGIARMRAPDTGMTKLEGDGDALVNLGLIRLVATGGAFLTSFAPGMMIGAVILESMRRRLHLSAMSALAYLSSVLIGAVMMELKPWLAAALNGIGFTELVASYFAAAFVFGILAYLIAQQLARSIGSAGR